ncbi:MAG: hypothetical protein ACE5NM_12375 [Sedimentisphaerales bacterium]
MIGAKFLTSIGQISVLGVLAFVLATVNSGTAHNSSASSRREKIPVIFDTDIGGDKTTRFAVEVGCDF